MTAIPREPNDVEIRQAIAAVIRGALVALHTSTLGNQIIVHDHWMWGFDIGQNANRVKIKEGVEKGKIHGWMVGLASVQRERPLPRENTPQGAHHLRKSNPNRRDVLRSYRVWCYHSVDAGESNNESNNNSENRLALEIEAVSDAFSRNPSMGIDNDLLMGCEELVFPVIDIFDLGGLEANVAQGTINVRLQKPLDLNQY